MVKTKSHIDSKLQPRKKSISDEDLAIWEEEFVLKLARKKGWDV
jgi:hypothetical protein